MADEAKKGDPKAAGKPGGESVVLGGGTGPAPALIVPQEARNAPPAPAARVCNPIDRAEGTGLRRFKIRTDGQPGSRYLLAPDRDAATAKYRDVDGCDKDAKLVVVDLPD